MIKKNHAAIVLITPFLVMLFLTELDVVANARGGGFAAHSFHSTSHFRLARHHARHRGAFGYWPLYGGLWSVPPYDDAFYNPYDYTFGNHVTYVIPGSLVPEPPRALSCKSSQQTVTVPSEEGGTREITIKRC